ncbi:MAG: YebC/PmpR family DNA-binding transcriptional regulator [Chlamydiae bacterium]|jgi:YebC/PmpR family DNA-binding regulatory protein|nr:YebC/PmpR family DNA-binding transcriptional regulator [Chlamydiota bacterium]
MAGHSKWANIKHRKEKADAKKGKLFSRVTKEIISAVKQGGPDAKNNPKLRLALIKAKEVNLPNDNIERNIKKAISSDQADFVEMMYEMYGHGGVGIIIDLMTDNKNRTASDMRIATNKRGGSIAAPGAVAYNFDRKGIIHVQKKGTIDEFFEAVIETGAEDVEEVEDLFIVTVLPDQLYQIKDQITALGYHVEEAHLEMIPKNLVEVSEEHRQANLALIEWLEALDDVDAVYHNMKLEE